MALSNPVTITVANPPAPQVYAAAGAAEVEVSIESILAWGARARVRRMTHADQTARYPSDDGFKFANKIRGRQFVFFTKNMLKNA